MPFWGRVSVRQRRGNGGLRYVGVFRVSYCHPRRLVARRHFRPVHFSARRRGAPGCQLGCMAAVVSETVAASMIPHKSPSTVVHHVHKRAGAWDPPNSSPGHEIHLGDWLLFHGAHFSSFTSSRSGWRLRHLHSLLSLLPDTQQGLSARIGGASHPRHSAWTIRCCSLGAGHIPARPVAIRNVDGTTERADGRVAP